MERVTFHVSRGSPSEHYWDSVEVAPDATENEILVRVLTKLAGDLRAEREGRPPPPAGEPEESGEWPEEFRCPACQEWTGVDDDYQRVTCAHCGVVIEKLTVAIPAGEPEE